MFIASVETMIVLAGLVIIFIVYMCLSLSKLNSIDKNIKKIAENSDTSKNKNNNLGWEDDRF